MGRTFVFEKGVQTRVQLLVRGRIDRQRQIVEDRSIRQVKFVEGRTIAAEGIVRQLIARDVDRVEKTHVQRRFFFHSIFRTNNEL